MNQDNTRHDRDYLINHYKVKHSLWGGDALQLRELFYSKEFDRLLSEKVSSRAALSDEDLGGLCMNLINNMVFTFIEQLERRDKINSLLEGLKINPTTEVVGNDFLNEILFATE